MRTLRHRGFTLLEMILVVFLIGVAATFVVINLERDIDQIADQEARRFAALLEHVRSETILTGRTIGVEVVPEDRGYRFLTAVDGWSEIEDDEILRPREIPEFLTMEVEVDEVALPRLLAEEIEEEEKERAEGESEDAEGEKEEDTARYIIVNAVGEISPFELRIRGDDVTFLVTLIEGQNLSVEPEAEDT